jgi:hypothetical protein
MSPERFRPNGKYHKVKINIEDTKPYMVTPVVLADGTKINAKLLVDSGASHGLMLEPSSDSKIKVPDSTVSSIIGRGLGGEITGKAGRVRKLELGPYDLLNPIANFPDPNSYFDSLKMGGTSRNGSIGGEILSRFTVVFNFPKEEVHLRKNASFKKKFHYNLSGLTLKARGSNLNVFEITQVRGKSSAARAGIMPGDVIVTINGIPANTLELNVITGYFNLKPGKKINLVLDRQGQRIRKNFRLVDQI